MSWQPYVDEQLVATGKIHRAAIIGQQGGEWAASGGYQLSTAEHAAIINAFNDKGSALSKGIHLAGEKYLVTRAEDSEGFIYGRKGANGCILYKTTLAILVAEYRPPVQAAEAVVVVESLAQHLISQSY